LRLQQWWRLIWGFRSSGMWWCDWVGEYHAHTCPVEQHHIPEKTRVLNSTTTRTLNLVFILWFSGVGYSLAQWCTGVHKFFKKSRSSLEISGTEDLQTLGTSLQNLITWVNWCLRFVHPWICGYQ
jgi:hypothetical protein